jgi:hypothetical protein
LYGGPPNSLCNGNSIVFNSYYRHKEMYIPYNDVAITPYNVKKKIKIRFLVGIPQTLEKKNFKPGDEPLLYEMVQWMNNKMAATMPTTKPQTNICGTCHIPDARINFELVGIDFFDYPTVTLNNWADDPPGIELFNIPGSDTVLNVFLFNFDNTVGYAGKASEIHPLKSFFTSASGQWVVLSNTFFNRERHAAVLIHEIFHLMGLSHLFGGETCVESEIDYLKDIFNTGNLKFCPQSNIADYCNPSHSQYSNQRCDQNVMTYYNEHVMSPMQLGRVHRATYLSMMHHFTYPTEAPTVHPWIVQEDEVWDFPIRVFQDIRVRSGSTLTIKCRVELPTDARIVVEPGSKLIIDGGIVTSYHQNATWGGIEVMGDNSQLSKASYQGYLELKNGAIVQHGGVRNFTWENGAQGGGIIRAENSHFHNSWRMVELNNYVMPYYDVVTNISNCSFKNCTFINDDDAPFIKMGHSDAALFTSFQTPKGVVIENCVFENQISETLQPQHKRGGAIHVAGSGLSITNSSFTGFKIGINGEGYTGSPETSMKIYSNTFENITKNITLTAQPFDNVKNNTIRKMLHYSMQSGGNGTPYTIQMPHGVYLNQTQGSYVGCNNKIYGNGMDDPEYPRGVVVNGSRKADFFAGNLISDNQLSELDVAVQTQERNPNLSIACNQLKNNYVALGINFYSNVNPNYTLKDQGTGCAPLQIRAGNVFANSNTYDIYSNLSNTWQYYAFLSSSNTTQYPYNRVGSVNVNTCSFTGNTDLNSPCKNFRPCLDAYVVSPEILKENTGIFRGLLAAGMKNSPEAQELLNVIVNDYNDLDDRVGLITFLQSIGTDDMRKLLLPLYVDNGNYTAAALTADSLTLPAAEKLAYKQYYALLSDLHSTGRTIMQLNTTEAAQVTAWAADSLEISPYAKTIMAWAYNTPWEHEVESTPMISYIAKPQLPVNNRIESERSNLQPAIPNPAMQTARIPVYINKADAALQPMLVIRNIMGRVVAQYPLTAGSQQITVDVRNFNNGIYTYSLFLNGKPNETFKLSVLH